MSYLLRGQADAGFCRFLWDLLAGKAAFRVTANGVRPSSSAEEGSSRDGAPARSDQFPQVRFEEGPWPWIPPEQCFPLEPEGPSPYERRYLVLSRGHADLLPTLQQLLAGREGIQIIVDRRTPQSPPEIAAHRAQPELLSPPGPAVIEDVVPLEALEAEHVPVEEEAPAPPVQRYLIVSRAHADLADLLRALQLQYKEVEVYVIVDRRSPEATPPPGETRHAKPELSSVPARTSRALAKKLRDV